MTRKSWQEIIYSYTVVSFFAIFLSLPILWMFSTAFKSQLDIFTSPPILFVKPNFQHLEGVFTNTQFMRSLLNSTITATGTVLFTMIIATPAAFGFSRIKGILKTNMLTWLLLTRAAPGMIYILPYFLVYSKIGLIDTRIGLIIINMIFTIPLVIWMQLTFFEDVPISIEEAALVDGANSFQIFTKIAIPVVMPGISSSAILAFIFSWNDFLFALIITRRTAMTAPVSIVNFMAYAGTEWGKVAVGGILILLPVLIFSVIIRKYLIQGMTAGAIKG